MRPVVSFILSSPQHEHDQIPEWLVKRLVLISNTLSLTCQPLVSTTPSIMGITLSDFQSKETDAMFPCCDAKQMLQVKVPCKANIKIADISDRYKNT